MEGGKWTVEGGRWKDEKWKVESGKWTVEGGRWKVERELFLVGDDEELGGVEEVLPYDVGCGAEGCHRVEVGLRHPDAERGVLLSEGLSGCDRRDTRHRLGCRGRVDEDILIVRSFAGCGEFITDEFADAELECTGEERSY